MCLIDTIDGALMLSLYIQPAQNFLPQPATPVRRTGSSSPSSAVEQQQHSRSPKDPIAFLYYSIVLTTLTVIVAVVVGVLQLLTMISNAAEPEGKFWEGVGVAGVYYDVIGGAICGCFILFGGISVFLYRPWRRWIDERVREELRQRDEEGLGEGMIEGGTGGISSGEGYDGDGCDANFPVAGSNALEADQGKKS
jgi:high-affinity nickel-transport protein